MIYSLFIAVQSVSGIAIFIMLETYRFLQYNVNNLNVKIPKFSRILLGGILCFLLTTFMVSGFISAAQNLTTNTIALLAAI